MQLQSAVESFLVVVGYFVWCCVLCVGWGCFGVVVMASG
jgi:hypothetical protein